MKDMSRRAQAFVVAAILAGGAVLAVHLPQLDPSTLWLTMAAALVAALTQIPAVMGPTEKSSYNLALVTYAFAFGVLGLPEALFVMMVASVAEWARHRYPWYIQTFNISALAVALAAAQVAASLVSRAAVDPAAQQALAIVAWTIAFILVNHVMVGTVILLARGEGFRESGVFHPLTLGIDAALLSLGSTMALTWQVNPYASILAAVPAIVLYASLRVPALERQAVTDPKTGLFNARYFSEVLQREVERAERTSTPLIVVVCDLDLLRNINNTYGHLAGDVVLIGVAKLLQARVREYDVVARIGGEEFAVIMPDTTEVDALARVENLRCEIESSEFEVETSTTPIRATMSFGVAEKDRADTRSDRLVHKADVALYRAKLEGRNRVCVATAEDLERSPLALSDRYRSVAAQAPSTGQ